MTNAENNWDELFEQLPVDATPNEDHREELKTRMLDQFDNQSPATLNTSRLNDTVRTIMKYKIPQWATAAAALVVCVIWFAQSYSPALAAEDVVAHIIKARTAKWDMIVKHEGSPDVKIRVYLASGQSRQEFDTGMVSIIDWNKGQSVGLFADQKLAMRRTIAKTPGVGMDYNHFEKMRDELRKAMSDVDNKVMQLGKQQVDGQTLVGLRFKPEMRTTTIWADPDTGFPVRIEIDIPGSRKTKVVMMNYKFNVDIDPALFSLEAPEGYSVRDENAPVSLGDEQDLIKSLRMYCESSGGTFPPALDPEAAAKYISLLVARNNAAQAQRSSEQLGKELLRLQRGFSFATALSSEAKWEAHYAGAGVQLDTPARPIFWYKPANSETYRVIYADLSARDSDTAPDADKLDTPKPPAVPTLQ